MRAPPQNPCTTRKATSEVNPVLAAQAALASVNPPAAAANMKRSDNSRVAQAVSGMAITSAVR